MQERFISKFARWYTPSVVGAAALIALIPPIFIAARFFMTGYTERLPFLLYPARARWSSPYP
jgi:Cd2+/Zn2+-exporting ATPase